MTQAPVACITGMIPMTQIPGGCAFSLALVCGKAQIGMSGGGSTLWTKGIGSPALPGMVFA